MCLAIPGKVVDIDKNKVIVDYHGEKRVASFQDIKLKKGDYVIVQGSFVIQKLRGKEAKEIITSWKSLLR